MDKHTTIASYTSGLTTTIVGGLSLQELAIWVGIVTTIGTFLVNLYYKRKEDKRAEAHDGQ